jgi:hypothetical protein
MRPPRSMTLSSGRGFAGGRYHSAAEQDRPHRGRCGRVLGARKSRNGRVESGMAGRPQARSAARSVMKVPRPLR